MTTTKQSDFGLIGLAVMGQNLVLNVESRGFQVSVYNRTEATTEAPTDAFCRAFDGLLEGAAYAHAWREGDVVVIGATNRPDALDPALRRPGRFDRELQFCAPDETQRRAILALHTESWAPSSKPTPQLLSALAARTAGFCGADLRALCTEAALAAVRRARAGER